jgi:acyl-CoA dehydrogenase
MTEPDVASSDATNVRLKIAREGGELVLQGRKWWTSGVLHPNCRVLIVMGKTDPEDDVLRQQSMVLVPLDTPGVRVERDLSVFGYHHHGGHGEVSFDSVRVPTANLLGEEGGAFAMSQARLGPGRIHHAMRAIGAAECALDLMCERSFVREPFGKPLATRDNVRDWIAESRIEIEMARLLVLKTAWLIDTAGSRGARVEIAAIKVGVPAVALRVVDRAIQLFGGAGMSQDTPLAAAYAHLRTLRISDGPDEVHKRTIARAELRRHGGAGR